MITQMESQNDGYALFQQLINKYLDEENQGKLKQFFDLELGSQGDMEAKQHALVT